MATQRDILKAVEGLPQTLLEQVKDFITRLKKKEGLQKIPLADNALAKKQVAAIRKWAGTNLGHGFSGRDHDEVLYGSGR